MGVVCDCEDPLDNIVNDQCADGLFGSQIVKIFVQKQVGQDFDGTASNTVSVQADWQTKLAAIDDDKIVVIDCVGVKPAADPNVISGQDVAYGATIVVDRPQNMDLFLNFPSSVLIDAINQAQCWGTVKISYLDNNGWLWADTKPNGAFIPDCSIIYNGLDQAGFGTKAKVPFKINWNNLCFPVPVAKYAFLKTIKNP